MAKVTEYKLRFEGTIFHTMPGLPPKLLKLGSGEILEWRNTVDNPNNRNGRIAEYKEAFIADFGYIHNSDMNIG